ncbi:hypothetical protein [Telmatospirillum sp.]|uniref:hypothetical protein n=1 Tax=Telmatospirillum sp. TaxID=2079197 RepID=UPI0028464A9E|nr:hypothetical protein [Telmatospirillum sp.]MDR3439892.1 hypothetical protein [Telmatospirillum sp.]
MDTYTSKPAMSGSLTYEIAELGWIADTIEALVDTIVQSSYALPDDIPRRALGPIDGLNWVTGLLSDKVRSLREKDRKGKGTA